MKVIYEPGKIKRVIHKAVLVIGVFDGVHLGHRHLIKKAIARAKTLKCRVVVLTFHPHPVQVLHPEIYLPYITSLEYRLKLLEELGVDVCIVQRFTKSFAKRSPKNFVEKYLMSFIRPRAVFVGADFRFGKGRSGDLESFKEWGEKYGFSVHAVDPVRKGKRKIGSTIIRRHIAKGELKRAAALLGRPVSIGGQVVRGDNRGKSLGFPTANIFPNGEVLPPLGVYAVFVLCGGRKYKGMANLGRRPSFADGLNPVNIEVHIFNFKKNIYGKKVVVQFIKRIRNEKAFNVKERLVEQLRKDEKRARRVLK